MYPAANDEPLALACHYFTPMGKKREGEMNILYIEYSLEQKTADILGETIQNAAKTLARQ